MRALKGVQQVSPPPPCFHRSLTLLYFTRCESLDVLYEHVVAEGLKPVTSFFVKGLRSDAFRTHEMFVLAGGEFSRCGSVRRGC